MANEPDVQVFSTGSGNWTKPAGAGAGDLVHVIIIGAGGSGGGGGGGVVSF